MSLPSRAAMTSELKLHLESVQGKAISSIRVSQGEMTVLANRASIVTFGVGQCFSGPM